MRQHKFKAWDKKNKKWIPIRSLDVGYNNTIVGINAFGDNPFDSKQDLNFKIDDIELVEFTGMRDYYEIDIYEDDIVKIIDLNYVDGIIGRIVFGKGGYLIVNKKGKILSSNCMIALEVIGNIREHPEKLE